MTNATAFPEPHQYHYPVKVATKSDDALLPTTVHTNVYTVPSNKKKSCCSWRICIPVCFCVLLAVVLLLVGIGLAIYFLYPRIPTITTNVSSMSLQSIDLAALTLNINFNLDLGVDNQNYLDLHANNINANVIYAGQTLGVVTYTDTLTFPKRTNQTQTVPLTFKSTTKDSSLLYGFAATCSAFGAKTVAFTINGNYSAFIQGISYTYLGTFSKTVNSPCCFGEGC
jgi:hypothetical protein